MLQRQCHYNRVFRLYFKDGRFVQTRLCSAVQYMGTVQQGSGDRMTIIMVSLMYRINSTSRTGPQSIASLLRLNFSIFRLKKLCVEFGVVENDYSRDHISYLAPQEILLLPLYLSKSESAENYQAGFEEVKKKKYQIRERTTTDNMQHAANVGPHSRID